jgi:acetolactate synthase-1/2/3 large subunit
MTGGEAIVDGLLAHGIDTVFGLPGAQIYGLFDALHRAQPHVKVFGARHEQTCGYMAFGYARSTGRPSVCAVVPGPGLLNAGAALLTAYGCNSAVLCLTGQVPRAFFGKGRGHLHEMPDQLATMRGFVKWADRIEHPSTAPALVACAFQEMLSGRQGPAALEMPWDVFTHHAEVRSVEPLPRLPNPPVDTDRVTDAARLIQKSRAPMIFVGSGALHAAEEVLELAELLDAPVVAFRSGHGVVSSAHELGINMATAYRLWPETDLMIGIGTRLELPGWRWPRRSTEPKSIRIDIDAGEMRRFTPDIGIVADAKEGTRELIAAARREGVRSARRRELIREASARAQAEIDTIQPQIDYLKVIREVLPADGFITDEISQVGFASWFGFPVYKPRTFVGSGYQGTLGAGFPSALGVKAANPRSPVVAVCGDGGFMFAAAELATAAQYGLGVVVLIFNNKSFGNVRRDQQRAFAGRIIGADLTNPDFVQLANAFGVDAARVASPAALRPLLEHALASDRPYVIEIDVPKDGDTDPWRFIQPARSV